MKTTDVSSITNSVLMAMEKEFRKNGMAGTFHEHVEANRPLIQGMVASIVADHLSKKDNENAAA